MTNNTTAPKVLRTANKKQNIKTARGRSVHATHWLRRHINDPFVIMAKKEGYRARSAFKLLDICGKFPALLRNCNSVVDLGCAPGSWLQVLQRNIASQTKYIIGIDLQDTEAIPGIEIIKGDFTNSETLQELSNKLPQKLDLVLSDMAASACGDRSTDHIRIMQLVEVACDFAITHLNFGKHFVAKILRGGEENAFSNKLKRHFRKVSFYKPKASYDDSAELFVIAQDLFDKSQDHA